MTYQASSRGRMNELIQRIARKVVRAMIFNVAVIALTLILTGCANIFATPEPQTSGGPGAEVTSSASETVIESSATPGGTHLESQTLPGLEGVPYPVSAENFIKTPGINGPDAKKIILEKGLEGDYAALENWYKAAGIVRSGMSNFTVSVINQGGGKFFWNLMVKDNNAHFLIPKITSGSEQGQVARAIGLLGFLEERPLISFSALLDPEGYSNVNQQIIWDKSGWNIIGAFQGDQLVAWFNADAPNGGIWVKLQEPIAYSIADTSVSEVVFDKSRFEVVDAEDGNEYQGYIQDDQFGARLVDETNSIVLVKKGDNWVIPESKNYSEEFPADLYYETKIGHADGFDIPITLGLSVNTKEAIDFSYSKIHITQQGADETAQLYLHLAWLKYKEVMGHANTSFEEYLSLLFQGRGNIVMINSVTYEQMLIDPRQGVSVVITGNRKSEMPLTEYLNGYNFDYCDTGKLMIAENSAYWFHTHELRYYKNSVLIRNNGFVGQALTVMGYITFPDRNLKGSVMANNDRVEKSSDYKNAINGYMQHFIDFYNGLVSQPLFYLE